jgi:glycosyltransferase involved in cell wall biosynthesis
MPDSPVVKLAIMFLLPVGGGSGGAHSVMQEAEAMLQLGVDVSVACNEANVEKLRNSYRDLPRIHARIHGYDTALALAELIESTSRTVVVATTNQSVHVLADALRAIPKGFEVRAAYYIQDYEPLFYDKDSEEWGKAFASFGLIPNMLHFAKTSWLQEVPARNHNIQVHKVLPSVDHSVFYPDLAYRMAAPPTARIAAMIRPSTPRRAPRRTVRILNHISKTYGAAVECVAFGCKPEELNTDELRLNKIDNLGVLSRAEVGQLFRTVDLFLDLSDYQAFGRTAVEAMSCGAASVVPAHGGAYEFAVHGSNSFIVDVRSDAQILDAVAIFTGMSGEERLQMSLRAIKAGYEFNVELAALSEIELFMS